MTLPLERLLIGRAVADRYRVADVLGRGGMSIVFRAEDLTLGRDVALKVVALPAAGESEAAVVRERFRREAGAAASIARHPNVVQVFDYGTDEALGLDFIAMELLRGEDLRQRLARGPLPLEAAMRIVIEAARGVAAGHRAGLLHRDVKPGNVFLLGPDGEEAVRVLDFGIAKPLGAEGDESGTLTVSGQLPHSPAYASPEQMDPEAALTPASDVYQLGLVAYETLTGAKPYAEAERDRIRAGQALPPPDTEPWREVPAAIRSVVARALAREPADRFADADAFAAAAHAAWETPSEEQASMAPASFATAPSRSWRPARITAALAGALVLATILWAAAGRREPHALSTDSAFTAQDSVFLALMGQVADGSGPVRRGRPSRNVAAENEIRMTVHEINRAWVDGDISRHVSHYASRVDYYNSSRLPRSGVARDRRRELRRYATMRSIDVGEIRLEWLAEDRVRALVRKAWDLRGEDVSRIGTGLQEYVFKRDDDDAHWYVVSEQLLSQTDTRLPTAAP
jgi:serine/threonine protein kinase